MVSVHLRLNKELTAQIQRIEKYFGFNSAQEFIREAIRNAIEEYEKKRAIRGLERLRGKGRLLTKAEQKKAKAELKNMSASDLFRKYGLD